MFGWPWGSWPGFEMVFGAKMEPCWHPKLIPTWMLSWKGQFRNSPTKRNIFLNILGTAKGEVGFKIGPKMGPKTKCQIRCILASIFDRFWSILGPKLGWKMEPKPIKKRYQNRSKKRTASKRGLDGSKRPRPSSTQHS